MAASAGEINEETRFILDYFGYEPPTVVWNVRNTVEDLLDDREIVAISTDMSLAGQFDAQP